MTKKEVHPFFLFPRGQRVFELGDKWIFEELQVVMLTTLSLLLESILS